MIFVKKKCNTGSSAYFLACCPLPALVITNQCCIVTGAEWGLLGHKTLTVTCNAGAKTPRVDWSPDPPTAISFLCTTAHTSSYNVIYGHTCSSTPSDLGPATSYEQLQWMGDPKKDWSHHVMESAASLSEKDLLHCNQYQICNWFFSPKILGPFPT